VLRSGADLNQLRSDRSNRTKPPQSVKIGQRAHQFRLVIRVTVVPMGRVDGYASRVFPGVALFRLYLARVRLNGQPVPGGQYLEKKRYTVLGNPCFLSAIRHKNAGTPGVRPHPHFRFGMRRGRCSPPDPGQHRGTSPRIGLHHVFHQSNRHAGILGRCPGPVNILPVYTTLLQNRSQFALEPGFTDFKRSREQVAWQHNDLRQIPQHDCVYSSCKTTAGQLQYPRNETL
jgi:hypothetical protein